MRFLAVGLVVLSYCSLAVADDAYKFNMKKDGHHLVVKSNFSDVDVKFGVHRRVDPVKNLVFRSVESSDGAVTLECHWSEYQLLATVTDNTRVPSRSVTTDFKSFDKEIADVRHRVRQLAQSVDRHPELSQQLNAELERLTRLTAERDQKETGVVGRNIQLEVDDSRIALTRNGEVILEVIGGPVDQRRLSDANALDDKRHELKGLQQQLQSDGESAGLVLSDDIATDPRILGERGALERRPGLRSSPKAVEKDAKEFRPSANERGRITDLGELGKKHLEKLIGREDGVILKRTPRGPIIEEEEELGHVTDRTRIATRPMEQVEGLAAPDAGETVQSRKEYYLAAWVADQLRIDADAVEAREAGDTIFVTVREPVSEVQKASLSNLMGRLAGKTVLLETKEVAPRPQTGVEESLDQRFRQSNSKKRRYEAN